MHALRAVLLAAALTALTSAPAAADITLFGGATTTPANRAVKGFALGGGLLFIGFEFEYADTTDEVTIGAPSLKTGSGNVLLQSPFPIFGFQPYFTTGAEVYRERLVDRTDTSVGANMGGGLKISLAGPLRLRVDYRVFRLGSDALYTPSHRIYAGLNLKF